MIFDLRPPYLELIFEWPGPEIVLSSLDNRIDLLTRPSPIIWTNWVMLMQEYGRESLQIPRQVGLVLESFGLGKDHSIILTACLIRLGQQEQASLRVR